MLRAGFVSLIIIIFFTCIRLSISAPLPERLSSLSKCYGADLAPRSLAILGHRELDSEDIFTKRKYLSIVKDREFTPVHDEYTKRGYDLSIFDDRDLEQFEYTKGDNSDVHMLYRRKSIFTKIKEGFQKAGRAIKGAFQKAGKAIKTDFQKAGKAMKTGFQKVGKVLKKGFQKVGKFIKTTGAKIVKFGLKVVAAVDSVAAKVVSFIPGVGPELSKVIKYEGKGANALSNKIHANLGKTLDKVSNGLDYVIDPLHSVAKAAGKKNKAIGVADAILDNI
jgi:hypothetical protein